MVTVKVQQHQHKNSLRSDMNNHACCKHCSLHDYIWSPVQNFKKKARVMGPTHLSASTSNTQIHARTHAPCPHPTPTLPPPFPQISTSPQLPRPTRSSSHHLSFHSPRPHRTSTIASIPFIPPRLLCQHSKPFSKLSLLSIVTDPASSSLFTCDQIPAYLCQSFSTQLSS